MYSVSFWRARIEPVEVGRLTAKTACVITKSGGFSREHLRTRCGGIFATWEEAHAALLANAERELNNAGLALQQAQGRHGNIVGMKKPCYNTETPPAPNPNEY
jgi:hypothetical protein